MNFITLAQINHNKPLKMLQTKVRVRCIALNVTYIYINSLKIYNLEYKCQWDLYDII